MKFKNITKKSDQLINQIQPSLKDCEISVFSYKDTIVILSKNEKIKHASLSNGNREVTMKEIMYTAEKLMNTSFNNVRIGVSGKGVVHLQYEIKMAKIYPFKQRVDHNA